MPERAIVLFDDAVAPDFRPLTLTRPAGELLRGALPPRARVAYDLERFLETTVSAMARRDIRPSERARRLLGTAWRVGGGS